MKTLKKISTGNLRLQYETGIVFVLVMILLSVISLISNHKMTQLLLTTKTSGSLKRQLISSVQDQNQLLETELNIKKNPEKYAKQIIGFVPDHLAHGCETGVWIFKVSIPPLESFIAVRKVDKRPVQIVNNPSLPLRIPIDIHQTGRIDRVYVVDQAHIWLTDPSVHINIINPIKTNRGMHLVVEAKDITYLYALPDANGQGIRLYFLGEYQKQKGLFMVLDKLALVDLNQLSQPVAAIAINLIQGDYRALFVRFGRLLLIPTNPYNKPVVLDLPSHEPVPLVWEFPCLNSPFILNISSQLNALITQIDEDKLGRQGWRKIKK